MIRRGDAMTKKNGRQEHVAKEREDIAARLAKFKATQDRFTREREEYAESTLQKAWLRAWSKEQVG
jgi:Skp family chaperone for outer membrane proteins